LAWEVYKWRQSQQLKVRVQLRHAFLGYEAQHVLSVTVLNGHNYAVRVTSWGLETNDGTGRDFVIVRPVIGSNLPGVVEARDSASGFADYAELTAAPELDFKRPLVAFANLATGERIRAEPQTLAGGE
jgi:hypothetical protein